MSRWFVPVIEPPAQPSRHRVAVRREPRRVGAELAEEIRTAKVTPAEPAEGERSLERLRRQHRDPAARDVFGTPEAAAAGQRLEQRVAACEDCAERVFAALHRAPGAEQ